MVFAERKDSGLAATGQSQPRQRQAEQCEACGFGHLLLAVHDEEHLFVGGAAIQALDVIDTVATGKTEGVQAHAAGASRCITFKVRDGVIDIGKAP